MKVLLACSYHFKTSVTGAGTQVRETYKALQSRGIDVERIYVRLNPVAFEDETGLILDRDAVAEKAEAADVVHLIHCSRQLAKAWRSMPRRPTVGSSIFWAGFERIQIVLKTFPVGMSMVKAVANHMLNMSRAINDFRLIDVFLPNSYAEGECVRKYYRLSPNVVIFPVNNGFVEPDFDVHSLPRPDDVPQDDYIVVPGIFANRKNQLNLIRALRDFPYPIVFMGSMNNDWYSNQCRREMTDKMKCIGFCESDSKRYWSVLSHARVACLPSDCETPGIAMIEAAFAGARPAITKFGGTAEYYGFDGEYFNPTSNSEIAAAVARAWERGRLSELESSRYRYYTWGQCAELTLQAYRLAIEGV